MTPSCTTAPRAAFLARRARALALTGRRVLVVAVMGVLVVRDALAQGTPVTVQLAGRIAGPASPIVSVLTMGQGAELFDRFGHMSLRVRDPATGLDSAWNWGMYDFAAPGFIPRFLTGETRYWMAGFPTPLLIDYYRRQGRAVWEQTLDLAPEEADSLLALLRWNARPENKFYRYDYYLDNCSTRVRDVIDSVLRGGLKRSLAGGGRGLTWRGETLRLATDFPVIGFGMTFALGPRADRPIAQWDELFIPMRLRDNIRDVRVTRALDARPLVRSEQVLVPEGRFVEADQPRSFVAAALLLGLTLAAFFVAVGGLVRRSAWARMAFGAAASAWHLVAGIAGTLVLLAGLVTRHVFMGANSNVLLGTPVSLALALLIPFAVSTKAGSRTRRVATGLAAFAAVAAAAALASHGVGLAAPSDLSPVMLAMPVHAAIAFAFYWRGHGKEDAA